MQIKKLNILFLVTVVFGASIFWFAPHPPMFDLPQHAGQIALLRDILTHQSPWTDLFQINIFTPYLVGYGLTLPLSLIMPIATALKLLLTFAYIAFIYMSIKLRKNFNADERLDWFFLVSFFGFAYKWGFFTFLVASPIGLFFILVADRYSQNRTVTNGLITVLVGLILLSSHGLVFLFALSVGSVILLTRVRGLKQLITGLFPFVCLVVMCGGYFLINQKFNTNMAGIVEGEWSLGMTYFGIERLPKALFFSVAGGVRNLQGVNLYIQGLTILTVLCTPLLLGLRPNWKLNPSNITFIILFLIILIVPSTALDTAFLYERFSLFLFPAYAWVFTNKKHNELTLSLMKTNLTKFTMPLLILMCWLSLSLHAISAYNFSSESKDIDYIVSKLKSKKRALMLIYDPVSKAADNMKLYAQYPVWYQAEKQGLVEFNYAWFPPMIVRYKTENLPAIRPGFEWRPRSFDWKLNNGAEYNYFILRSSSELPINLFEGAECIPQLVISRGLWKVYERVECN